MKSSKKTVKIDIRIDLEMKNELQLLADTEKRRLSDFIRLELEKIIQIKKEENKVI